MSIVDVIFLNIVTAVFAFTFGIIMMKMMGYSKYARETQNQAKIEDYKKQETRLKYIMEISDRHMNTVPTKLRTNDRQILVPYVDLLKIWDIAWHTKNNL